MLFALNSNAGRVVDLCRKHCPRLQHGALVRGRGVDGIKSDFSLTVFRQHGAVTLGSFCNMPHSADSTDRATSVGDDAASPFLPVVEHFLNSVDEACAIVDLEGRIIRANLAYRRLTGPAAGAHDASFLSFLDPEPRQEARAVLSALAYRRASRRVTLPFRIGRGVRLVEVQLTWSQEIGAFAFVGRDVTEKDVLERERAESAAERGALEQAGGIGYWRAGRDFKLRLSPSAARIFGLDPKGPAIEVTDILDIIKQEDRPGAIAAAKEMQRSKAPLNTTFRVRRPDGIERVVQVVGSPTTGSGGEIDALHGVVIDKTDAHAAFSSAMRSESVSRRFLHSAPIAAAMFDRDMRLLMASEEYFLNLERSEADTLGRSYSDILPWTPRKWLQALTRAMRGERMSEEADQFEIPGRGKRYVRWSCGPWRTDTGEIGGVIIMHQDVTDHVESQRDVDASRRRLQIGAAMAGMLIWEIDFNSRDCRVEGDWRRFLPEVPTYDLLASAGRWVHPADREMVASAWRAQLRGAPSEPVEHRVAMPGDREVWQSICFAVIRDDAGDPMRVVATVQDITQRKQAEHAAQEAELRAATAAEARSHFLASMTHELRSPLNGVISVADVLERTRLDESQRDMVKLVQTSGRTLLEMFNDVLEYSFAGGATRTRDERPFTIEQALRPAIDSARQRADAKSLAFDVLKSTSLEGVFIGDSDRLRQVVAHLLGNAVKFTESGSVTLSLGLRDAAPSPDGEQRSILSIVVAHTGVGLAANDSARLFEAFVTGRSGAGLREEAAELQNGVEESPKTRPSGGLGLGLSIVKRLVEEMGGRLDVRSEEGAGSAFSVDLPLRIDRISNLSPRQALAAPDEPGQSQLVGARILIADDNQTSRRVIELLIGSLGVDLTFVTNGEHAVDACMGGDFELVIMDVQMPVLSGLDAIGRIREHERTSGQRRTPIIVVSANSGPEHTRRALAAGADDLVGKPIDRATLVTSMARHALVREGAAGQVFDLDDLPELPIAV
ncbi:PAS domain-containing protein [bacterium]|nr:PAS domain-containing protein [bacterium]